MVRTAARRSALQVCRVRGRNALPPSDSEIENEKNPRRMLSARVDQTRLDDVILPVFCPTSQILC